MGNRYAVGTVISHWNHLIEDFQFSPQTFYEGLTSTLLERQVPDIRFTWVKQWEGGFLSAQRTYLRVSRHEYNFYVCGAPFGNAFFVSWWLTEKLGCLGRLAEVSLIGFFFKQLVRPTTFYRIDTALMFQESIHAGVLQLIDVITSVKGIRKLTEQERKPIMREFFAG